MKESREQNKSKKNNKKDKYTNPSKEDIINQAYKVKSQGNKIKGFEDKSQSKKKSEKNSYANLSKEDIINQADKFYSQGNISEAEKYYQLFLNKGFSDPRVSFYLGGIFYRQGKLEEAKKSLQESIKLNPDSAIAHYNLGKTLSDLGKLQEAEISYRKAIKIKPDYSEAYYNLGHILSDLGKPQEAGISYRKAIEIKPDYAEAYSNLGNILRDLGKSQEAEYSYRKAIESKPDYAEAHSNLGNILREIGKSQEAELLYRKAIEIKPDYAEAHLNLGNILKDIGKLQEAESSYHKAIEIKPNYASAFYNFSFLELLQCDYKNGLENYEFRFKKKKPTRPHGKTKLKRIEHKKLKKGEKLLVISEQGLGDTLQFMRYIPYLRSQGLDVSFCAQEKLHSLIQSSGIDPNPLTPKQANTVSEGEWIPLLSLPRHLQISPKNPIISKPYIYSTNELNQKWKNILSKEKKPIIGINWQGNPKMEKTYQGRSLPLEIFSILADHNKITLLSLQKGFGSEQLEHCSFKNKFVECQQQIDSTWDFLENAAIIENCDLIITCDTSIAHLAGGMGKPTWLLLHHLPDWRWGLEGENTFWYPSMRLFRQKERHNWQEVMERVSIALNDTI